jgi:hypothetical protein
MQEVWKVILCISPNLEEFNNPLQNINTSSTRKEKKCWIPSCHQTIDADRFIVKKAEAIVLVSLTHGIRYFHSFKGLFPRKDSFCVI